MRRRCLSFVPLCCVISACTNSENARLSLDRGLVLEGVNPGRAERIEPLERLLASENSIRPVAASLDRSSWESTRVRVPGGGVRHLPSYTDQWIPAYSDRAQGLAPNLMSALDKGDAGLEVGFGEGVASVAITIFDALAIIPRMLFVDPYWEYNQSPELAYERRTMRPWIPLAMAPDGDEPRVLEFDADAVPGRIQRINEPEQAESAQPEGESPEPDPPADDPAPGPSESDPAETDPGESDPGEADPPVGDDPPGEAGQEDDTTDPPGVSGP